MKSVLSLAVVAAFLLAGLAGCNHSNGSDTVNAANGAAPASPPAGQPAADAAATTSAPAANATPAPPPPVTVPSGTTIHVALADSLSTTKNQPGDRFAANLSHPIEVDGVVVFEKGAAVHGRVEDVKESGRVKGLASISLVLTGIERAGANVPITTDAFSDVAKSTRKKDAEVVGGGAGIGAVIGAIAGGKKGAGIGALVGGGAGTADVLATRGQELNYPVETALTFRLARSVDVHP